jgi:hypothetical protein
MKKISAGLSLKTISMGGLIFALGLPLPVPAVSIVRMDAPATVAVGQSFAISLYVDGLDSPDSLVRFGFNFGYQPSVLDFTGFTVAAPFQTAGLPGPYTGWTSPGVAGSDILIGSLNFTAVSVGMASLDVGDQNDAPLTTGLFTTLNPDRYRVVGHFVDVYVVLQSVPKGPPWTADLGRRCAGAVPAPETDLALTLKASSGIRWQPAPPLAALKASSMARRE